MLLSSARRCGPHGPIRISKRATPFPPPTTTTKSPPPHTSSAIKCRSISSWSKNNQHLRSPPASRRYIHNGTRTIIEPRGQPSRTPRQRALESYIRTCLTPSSQQLQKNPKEAPEDTNFTLSFLGTASSKPKRDRNCPCAALRLGGMTFLFDAGEGTQRQLAASRLSVSEVTKMFITHMHGDHVLGLPGLILSMNAEVTQNRIKNSDGVWEKRKLVEVYGPVGLFEYLTANLAFCRVTTLAMDVVVYELGTRSTPFSPPRYANRRIRKKTLYPNEEGIWTISTPTNLSELTEEEILEKYALRQKTDPSKRTNRILFPNESHAGTNREFHIHAAEVRHTVPTFGYSVREMDPPKRIDADAATRLGVPHGTAYTMLKNGIPVWDSTGRKKIHPEDVCLPEEMRARKMVLLGDNCGVSPGMKKLSMGCDLLVNEATVTTQRASETSERGHSTPSMAGRLAAEVSAKLLILHHFPAAVQTLSDLEKIETEAMSSMDGCAHVISAFDFMEVIVPRGGFDFKQ